MRQFLKLLFIVSFLPLAAKATEFSLAFEKEVQWELAPSPQKDFNQFIENERQQLLQKIEGLSLTNDYSNEHVFLKDLQSFAKDYSNYQVSCRFLKKIRKDLTGSVLKDLNQITKDGKICTVADVPKEEASAWTMQLADFFWNKKWIRLGKKTYTLKSYLDQSVDLPVIPKTVALFPVKSQANEGYPTGVSAADLDFIQSIPELSEVFSRFENTKIDDPSTYPSLGEDAAATLDQAKESFAVFFVKTPGLAIGYGWSPADLIELIAHEYGHVLHSQNQKSFRIYQGQAVFTQDNIWHEAVAESFAWNGLQGLTSKFPEVRILHIFKLNAFSHLRPTDPHYIGAASVAALFHQNGLASKAQLSRLMTAADLPAFLKAENIQTLENKGASGLNFLKFIL